MLSHEQCYPSVTKLAFPPMQITLSFNLHQLNVLSVNRWIYQVYPGLLICSSDEDWNTYFSKLEQDDTLSSLESETIRPECGADIKVAKNFAYCISLMSLLMFKQLNCPVFDLPEVLSININPNETHKVDVVFSVTNIGLISRTFLKKIFFASYTMCRWLGMQSPDSSTLRADGLNYLKTEIMPQLDYSKDAFSSTVKLLEVVHKAGIHYYHMGNGSYRLGWGKHASLFYGSVSSRDSYSGVRLAGDKYYVTKLLKAAGLSVPVHRHAMHLAEAIQACRSLGFPVVVKPVDSERGEGVTVGLTDELSLPAAFEMALQFSKSRSVLIERQVAGVCHRLFMVDDRLLYAVKRWPPSVFGDGISTIRQLVDANMEKELSKLPSEQFPLVPWDDETEGFIRQIGLNADYIPLCLQRIPLRPIESTQWGGFDEEVTTQVHPDTLRQARIACRLVQMSVVGVDVITDNIGLPLSDTGGVINELNGGPSLGGTDISRSYIPEYLRRLIPNNGKVNVEVFCSAELEKAMLSFRLQREKGVQCYFVSDSLVIDYQGEEMLNQQSTLAEQLRVLIFNPDVEALCIVSDALINDAIAGRSDVSFLKKKQQPVK
jgi:cyanophycin synthetase